MTMLTPEAMPCSVHQKRNDEYADDSDVHECSYTASCKVVEHGRCHTPLATQGGFYENSQKMGWPLTVLLLVCGIDGFYDDNVNHLITRKPEQSYRHAVLCQQQQQHTSLCNSDHFHNHVTSTF